MVGPQSCEDQRPFDDGEGRASPAHTMTALNRATGDFPRLLSLFRPEPSGHADVPLLINKHPARLVSWTPEAWACVPSESRPPNVHLLNGNFVGLVLD
jgi:hypothetical protein